jgi:5'-nucleotidase
MNAGGIRAAVAPVLGPDGLGDVTYGMLFAAQPFNNLLVTMSLSGAQILEVLSGQFQGERTRFLDASSNLAYRWRAAGPEGREIIPESIRISGVPLDRARTYRVTVNAYMASRGAFAEGTDRVNGPVDLDALVAYLERSNPFEMPPLRGVELASRP